MEMIRDEITDLVIYCLNCIQRDGNTMSKKPYSCEPKLTDAFSTATGRCHGAPLCVVPIKMALNCIQFPHYFSSRYIKTICSIHSTLT